jgi:hypothetical protein
LFGSSSKDSVKQSTLVRNEASSLLVDIEETEDKEGGDENF